MYLIAVDEAGYGPKLGPLIVAATCWRLDGSAASELFELLQADEGPGVHLPPLLGSFSPLSQPVNVAGEAIRVDDSKRVFRRTTASAAPLETLQKILSVAVQLCRSQPPVRVNPEAPASEWPALVRHWIGNDADVVRQTPWLAGLVQPELWPRGVASNLFDAAASREALTQWQAMPWHLQAVRARVITADRFNHFCDAEKSGGRSANKSDLLSETSLGLVADYLRSTLSPAADPLPAGAVSKGMADEIHDAPQRGWVFFDRHGGRRYYASVLQHIFPDCQIEVLEETPRRSVYRVSSDAIDLTCHFTVQGDSFAPVALASLHAKYVRELAMACLNQFFHDAWRDWPSSVEDPPKPTAGYPVDADRYLAEIQPLWATLSASCPDLVRCR